MGDSVCALLFQWQFVCLIRIECQFVCGVDGPLYTPSLQGRTQLSQTPGASPSFQHPQLKTRQAVLGFLSQFRVLWRECRELGQEPKTRLDEL